MQKLILYEEYLFSFQDPGVIIMKLEFTIN